MQFERLSFGFFLVLALALDVVFIVGEIDNPQHHGEWVLTLAILTGTLAAVIKLGDRSHVGLALLSSTAAGVLLLAVAWILWFVLGTEATDATRRTSIANTVGFAAGAMIAYSVAVATFIGDTLLSRH